MPQLTTSQRGFSRQMETNDETNEQNEVKNPAGWRRTSRIFTSVTEELSSELLKQQQ